MKTAPESQKHCVCNTQKICSLGVLLIILFGVVVVAFFVFFCDHKSVLNNLNNVTALMAAHEVQGKEVAYDLFLSTITDFYTNIIVILTALIGIVSIIGFLYIKNTSSKEVVAEVNSVILGDHFRAYLRSLIKEEVSKAIEEDSDLSDIVEKYSAIANLSERITFLEGAVNGKSSDKLEVGGADNGCNTTIE